MSSTVKNLALLSTFGIRIQYVSDLQSQYPWQPLPAEGTPSRTQVLTAAGQIIVQCQSSQQPNLQAVALKIATS